MAAALGASLIDSSLDQAGQWYLKAAELAWDDPRALPQAALGLAHIQSWDEAERVCERIEALASPTFDFEPELDHVRGSILFGREGAAAALPRLRAAHDALPTLDHGAVLVEAYVELEMYRDAQPVIERGLRSRPRHSYLLSIRTWMVEEGLWDSHE
ncbi:hypothetical protein [Baekduia sp.]|uniref:hypothetical protein n=1 Tax=Baekduia sp. TaxID=2600305 RepID=UPI0039C8AD3F